MVSTLGGPKAECDLLGQVELLAEAIDATGRVNKPLLASVKRMARGAYVDVKFVLFGRASLEGASTRAVHSYDVIVRVNFGFHWKYLQSKSGCAT
jgi:hypothetical protein